MTYHSNSIEVIRCPRCRESYDADSDDLGTYFCPKCPQKPRLHDYEALERFVAALFTKNSRLVDNMRKKDKTK